MNAEKSTVLPIFIVIAALAGAQLGCDAAKKAADDLVEDQLGCSDAQLDGFTEPDLPDCSRVAACCRFLSGDCGQVRFTPHPDVVTACNANETIVAGIVSTYQSISADQCPAVLQASACEGGVEQTKANYVAAINDGVRTSASAEAPSCRRIAKETIGKLSETAGGAADLLPEACTALDRDKEPVVEDPAGGEGEGEAAPPAAGGEGEGEATPAAGGEGEGEGEG